MTEDARFEDAGVKPVNLGALDTEDVQVISSLVQDAVLTGADLQWDAKARRLALLINRVRWEDAEGATRRSRTPERVRTVLVVDHVLKVASQGVTKGDADTVLSLLSVAFEPGEDGSGTVFLTLAGDGTIRAEVEALEVSLKDVTRPYAAVSRKLPEHPE